MVHTKKDFTITLGERLDAENVDNFKTLTKQIMEDPELSGIVIDFSQTKFIDSIGLGALVSVLKSSTQLNIKIALCKLSPQVRQIFELTRLYRLFDIFEEGEEAEIFVKQ
jgi:anti-sigma B factor antagonist